MATITIQNYHDCYDYGKEIFLGHMSKKDATDILVNTGMSKKSAVYYLQCVVSMLSGERYTATVKELASSYFLKQIYNDYGATGLQKALSSMRAHLDYQKGKNELPGTEKIYQEFLDIL